MIKRYNQFVNDKINEDLESGENINDFNENPMDFNQEPVDDFEEPMNDFEPNDGDDFDGGNFDDVSGFDGDEEISNLSGEEEEEDDYPGTQKMEELAEELGVELREDGSLSYNGVEVHFYSETEKFHIDKMRFTTVEEVINYLENGDAGDTSDDVESNSFDQISDADFENTIEESKRYRNTRLQNSVNKNRNRW